MDPKQLQCLHRHWTHSHEEDRDGLSIYRPPTFKFRAARGRTEIEFHPDGTLVHRDAGPTDAGRTLTGSWKHLGGNAVQMHVETFGKPRRMTVVECNDQVLKLRWD